jgi:glycosyltransferase involved in cell wall biosynthesis
MSDHDPGRCLSVVMPCYNEATTLEEIASRVLASPFVAELVIVDDGSTDGTRKIAESIDDERVRVFAQPMNMGKGAALRRGFAESRSPYVIVQDADLEYDPAEYVRMLTPLLDGLADVVYGTRFGSAEAKRVLYYWHSVGNGFLTMLSNMFTDLNLTDMETCYKAFRREVLESFELQEDRFGVEPEITAKVARMGWRVYEVGISYSGRTYDEGKKIGWKDGVRALYSILRYSPILERWNGHPVVRDAAPVEFSESDAELATVLDSLRDADRYADWIFSMCEPYLGSSVLEVGAGVGDFTERLRAGREVTAIDLSQRCVGELRARFAGDPSVTIACTDVDGLDGEARFDSAIMINVLEHIDDDLGTLQALRRVVKPGGRILVFSPAFDGLYSDFDRDIGHRRRYRISHLAMLGDRAGLEIEDVHYVNSVGAFAWWLMARRLRRVPTQGWSVKLYDRAAVPVVRRLEARKAPRVGQSVFLAARRPVRDPA